APALKPEIKDPASVAAPSSAVQLSSEPAKAAAAPALKSENKDPASVAAPSSAVQPPSEPAKAAAAPALNSEKLVAASAAFLVAHREQKGPVTRSAKHAAGRARRQNLRDDRISDS